jgi:hypothetical protein
LPVRGLLLASITDPYFIILIQLFDGLGAAVFGVLTPLVVSDIAPDTGHYTTAGTAPMLGDLRFDQFAEMRFQAFVRALLIGSHQARIAGHIRGKDRG